MDTWDKAGPDQVYTLQKVFILATAVPYFVLVWDWLANLPKEYSLLFRSSNGTGGGNRSNGGILSIKNAFVASRYTTLVWCTFVVVVLGSAGSHPSACSWSKYFPYGYSTTMLFAHFVMVLRMFSIYERKKKILIFLLVLTALDYMLQMSANHAATSVYLSTQNPSLAVCFVVPTSLLYSLVFISPTVFHHIILVMTLYKSIQHIRATRAGGITSIMQVVQRDQIFFVLAICLINFSNMVLVFQGSNWPYRLINQLPAAAFTQIFLSRIIFNLKHVQKKIASASASPVITTLALSPSSRRGEFKFGDGSGESPDDFELGGDFKSSSTYMNSPDIGKEDGKGFFSSHNASEGNNNGKKNVFTLKFDPKIIERKHIQSSSASSSTNYAVAKPSPLNKDAFRIENGNMDSYTLSAYRLPSARRFESDQIESPYAVPYNELERHPSPTSPSTPLSAPDMEDRHGHQRSSSSEKKVLSPHSEVARTHDISSEQPAPKQNQERISKLSFESDADDGRPEPALYSKSEGQEDLESTRASFESANRRASTIDDQQRSMDWAPPNVWGTSQSPRASPIPFSERRLSSSVARNSLSIQRSRHPSLSTGTTRAHRHSLDSASSRTASATITAGVQRKSADPVIGRNRASACYASIFSFDNDERCEDKHEEVDSEDGGQSQPIPTDVDKVNMP